MSKIQLESNDQPQRARDPDFMQAEAALHRAAQLARRRAWQAGIGVIVMKDEKIVEEMQAQVQGVVVRGQLLARVRHAQAGEGD